MQANYFERLSCIVKLDDSYKFLLPSSAFYVRRSLYFPKKRAVKIYARVVELVDTLVLEANASA